MTGERRPRQPWAALVLTLVAVLVVAGCTDGTGDSVGGTPTETATSQDQPLLQVHTSGGYSLTGTDFSTVARLTAYPDGRAVTHGPQIAIYPPPALPALQLHALLPSEVDALVDLAREARLLADGPDYGSPPVADAPLTSVTLRVDGSTYRHEVDGLGVDSADGTLLPGMSPQAREAREVLDAFIQDAQELVASAAEGVPYRPEAYAVLAHPSGPTGLEVPSGIEEPNVIPWTVDEVPLTDAEDCVLVTGSRARDVERTLTGADTLTLFEQDGVVYDVWVRPLLPGEQGCADVALH